MPSIFLLNITKNRNVSGATTLTKKIRRRQINARMWGRQILQVVFPQDADLLLQITITDKTSRARR